MTTSKSTNQTPVLHDCRRYSSLSWMPTNNGLTGSVAAHEGAKPSAGDYLALKAPEGGAACYRVLSVDLCMNVDPANMWIARVEFVPGREVAKIKGMPDLPQL